MDGFLRKTPLRAAALAGLAMAGLAASVPAASKIEWRLEKKEPKVAAAECEPGKAPKAKVEKAPKEKKARKEKGDKDKSDKEHGSPEGKAGPCDAKEPARVCEEEGADNLVGLDCLGPGGGGGNGKGRVHGKGSGKGGAGGAKQAGEEGGQEGQGSSGECVSGPEDQFAGGASAPNPLDLGPGSGMGGDTGVTDGGTPPLVPLPAPVLLCASGLGLLGLRGAVQRRRRREH